MRRSEFSVDDAQAIQAFLDECDYGVLSLISEGEPYGVAVNFAFDGKKFYFHGALEGRKAGAIGTDARCSFTVVKSYAYIPSYFSDTRSACPATQYFASVIAGGRVVRIDDTVQKAVPLNALMQKMQSEGGYETIDAYNPIYTKMLEKTGVYVIEPDFISFKVKAGQNLSKERHDALLQRLEDRGETVDFETARVMQEFTQKERL